MKISRCIQIIALMLAIPLLALFAYRQIVIVPERRAVVQQYENFRAIVATGDKDQILKFVAPGYSQWATERLHVYENFAQPLNDKSSVSVLFRKASIRIHPVRHYYVIPGGNVIKMIKHDGRWLMGRVHID